MTAQKEEMPQQQALRSYCTWTSSQSLRICHLHHEGIKQRSQHEQICLQDTATVTPSHTTGVSIVFFKSSGMFFSKAPEC
jgi:hypothetical protein